MKIWKIEHTNKNMEGVKIAISISSSESKGIILKNGEFVLAKEQLTASIDSQTRRGFIKVDSFDNSTLRLNLGEAYKIIDLLKQYEPTIEGVILETSSNKGEEETLSKLQEAEKDASDYINNKEKQ